MKKILVIGADSKIAKTLQQITDGTYSLVLSSRKPNMTPEKHSILHLDLSDATSVKTFTEQVADETFAAVFIFASTYRPDQESTTEYLEQAREDSVINALAPISILRSLRYEAKAKVFLFGDAGLDHPKEKHSGYSISKLLFEHLSKELAVELAPKDVSVIMFRLGPTVPSAQSESAHKEFHHRRLLGVEDPAKGLIKLCLFLLEEPNISITGTIIDYDGGAYLKRNNGLSAS